MKNLGKSLRQGVEEAFNLSKGARSDEEDVQRNLIVIVSGNVTDDADEAKQLVSNKKMSCNHSYENYYAEWAKSMYTVIKVFVICFEVSCSSLYVTC